VIGDRANAVFRRVILTATVNPAVRRVVARYGMRFGGSRFVAGEDAAAALPTLAELDRQGFKTNTTLLGEAITDRGAVERVVSEYERMLAAIGERGLRTNLAVKPSQLGLEIDEELVVANVHRLARLSAAQGKLVRMDMEDSGTVDATLRVYRRLREEGVENVGTVLQAYLHRTPDDLESLLPLEPNLRYVKGAYREPPEAAIQSRGEVDEAFWTIIRRALESGSYAAIATHDERIIEKVRGYEREHGIGRDRFEFQMLYGVRPELQRRLLSAGYTVLVATPYGSEWYPYLMRRLAERPANLLFAARSIVGRR
jgi:proline dehydrogenase